MNYFNYDKLLRSTDTDTKSTEQDIYTINELVKFVGEYSRVYDLPTLVKYCNGEKHTTKIIVKNILEKIKKEYNDAVQNPNKSNKSNKIFELIIINGNKQQEKNILHATNATNADMSFQDEKTFHPEKSSHVKKSEKDIFSTRSYVKAIQPTKSTVGIAKPIVGSPITKPIVISPITKPIVISPTITKPIADSPIAKRTVRSAKRTLKEIPNFNRDSIDHIKQSYSYDCSLLDDDRPFYITNKDVGGGGKCFYYCFLYCIQSIFNSPEFNINEFSDDIKEIGLFINNDIDDCVKELKTIIYNESLKEDDACKYIEDILSNEEPNNASDRKTLIKILDGRVDEDGQLLDKISEEDDKYITDDNNNEIYEFFTDPARYASHHDIVLLSKNFKCNILIYNNDNQTFISIKDESPDATDPLFTIVLVYFNIGQHYNVGIIYKDNTVLLTAAINSKLCYTDNITKNFINTISMNSGLIEIISRITAKTK